MIKVNLKTQGQAEGAFVGNIDLSQLNLPMLIISILFTGLAPMGLESWTKASKDEVQKTIDDLGAQQRDLNKELASLSETEAKISKMEAEEIDIKNRIQVLQNLLKEKANPRQLMQYIAEHIPNNIWITKINISNKMFTLEGNALDYDSIGKFVDALNQSIFFDSSAKLENYGTKDQGEAAVRLEEFRISAKVARFE